MPRPHRLDFRNAIQLVGVSGRNGLRIFFDIQSLARFPLNIVANAPRARQIEQLITETCTECGARLYAYSIEPNALGLVLCTSGASLETFMRRLCGQFSRYWRRHHADAAGPFERRYESKVIAPAYLPHAVRRMHARLRQIGFPRLPTEFPFSSARVYLGARARVPLDLEAVGVSLARRGLVGIRGYRDFMAQPETVFVTQLFERGSVLDSRIVGDKLFVTQARQRAAEPWPGPTREQMVAAIAQLMRTEPTELLASSAAAVIGRSLIAWHGVRNGAAPLKEIAHWFGVTGATLRRGIRHYRRVAPELFSRELPGLEYSSGTETTQDNPDDV
jgi:hypothetical protein